MVAKGLGCGWLLGGDGLGILCRIEEWFCIMIGYLCEVRVRRHDLVA